MSKRMALLSSAFLIIGIGATALSAAPARADGADPCCRAAQKIEHRFVGYRWEKRKVPIYETVRKSAPPPSPTPCCTKPAPPVAANATDVPVVVRVTPKVIVETPIVEYRPAAVVQRPPVETPCPPQFRRPLRLPATDCCESGVRGGASTQVSWRNDGPADICNERDAAGLPRGEPFDMPGPNGTTVRAMCK